MRVRAIVHQCRLVLEPTLISATKLLGSAVRCISNSGRTRGAECTYPALTPYGGSVTMLSQQHQSFATDAAMTHLRIDEPSNSYRMLRQIPCPAIKHTMPDAVLCCTVKDRLALPASYMSGIANQASISDRRAVCTHRPSMSLPMTIAPKCADV